MPYSIEYDPRTRFLKSRFWGEVTDAEIVEGSLAVIDDPRIGQDTIQLVDLGGVTSGRVSPGSLRSIVESNKDVSFKMKGHRVAVFAPTDLAFGFSKMYEALSKTGGAGTDVRVFRAMDEALEWLLGRPQA